jgi:hypothetical protein
VPRCSRNTGLKFDFCAEALGEVSIEALVYGMVQKPKQFKRGLEDAAIHDGRRFSELAFMGKGYIR